MLIKNILIFGGNGFIAKSLIEKINNVRSSKKFNIFLLDRDFRKNKTIKFNNKIYHYVKANLESEKVINLFIKKLKTKNITQIDEFWNLCANSDIKISSLDNDLKNTYLTCFYSGKILNKIKVKKYIFSSSSAVYGFSKIKFNEDFNNFNPISMYGLMKLNCENYLKYLSNEYKTQFIILRFPNVIGPDLTHGVIFDFLKKVKKNSKILLVLGNGEQKKPYLYVDDLINIILKILTLKKISNNFDIFNISPSDNGIKVAEIASLFKNILYPDIKIKYSSKNNFGWKGDVPSYQFDTIKINSKGIHPSYTSRESVIKTLLKYK